MITLTDTPVLETDRLILRAPDATDWPLWRDFHGSDRARYIGGGAQTPPRESWRAFGHLIGHWVLRGYGMFAITDKESGASYGICGPWFPEGWAEQEIGWTIWSPQVEGRGFAFEAAHAARDYAYDVLGWKTAVSNIHPENARSIALAERLGAWHDPDAALPQTGSDMPTHVYRHPAPGDVL